MPPDIVALSARYFTAATTFDCTFSGPLTPGPLTPASWKLNPPPDRRQGAAPVVAAGNAVTGNTAWVALLVAPPLLHYSPVVPDLRDAYGRLIPPFTLPLTICP